MARIGMELNRTQAANFCGVAELTVDAWRRGGLPSRKIGRAVKFNSKAIVDWLVERARAEVEASFASTDGAADDESMAEAQRRRAVAEARLAELKLGQLEGGLVTIDEWKKASEDLVAHVRRGILNLPFRAANDLAFAAAAAANPHDAESLRIVFQEILESSVRDVLNAMAEPLADSEDGEDADEIADPQDDPEEN